uniref:Universal stress protein n=1 Tax=Roseihalotalea indica TaxID=2867963 RepID=A0AA49JJ79_9BACT|nr:universal stress protein [Tunicatimonas sp. TK19036]
MKIIAVPTDFSFQTLRVMQSALQLFPNETIHFLLFSISELPTDTQDLLFLPSQKEQFTIEIRENFGKGINLLKKAHSYQIEQVVYDHFWGSLSGVIRQLSSNHSIDLLLLPQSEDSKKYDEQARELIQACPCPLLFIPDTFTSKYPSKVGWIVQDDFNANVYLQASQSLFFDETVETLFMTAVSGQNHNALKEHMWRLLDLHAASPKLSFAFNRQAKSTRDFLETTLSHQVDLLLLQQRRRNLSFKKKDMLIEEISLLSPVPVLIFPHNHFIKAA